MKDDDKNKDLYHAAEHYLVSERADVDAWKLCATFVGAECGLSIDKAKAAFVAVEARIKADYKLSTMPVRWRSAKSTLLAALRAGVDPIDSLGLSKPKTYLSNQVKATKAAPTGSVSPMAQFKDAMDSAKIAYAKMSVSEQSLATIMVLSLITPPHSLVTPSRAGLVVSAKGP